eukprot:1286829-Amphidinium_carterae.1
MFNNQRPLFTQMFGFLRAGEWGCFCSLRHQQSMNPRPAAGFPDGPWGRYEPFRWAAKEI